MNKRIYLFILLLLPMFAGAQVLPAEGSKLNFRLVGFSFPGTKGAQYELKVARGKFSDTAAMNAAIVVKQSSTENSLFAELPLFGADYTWYVVSTVGNKKKVSALHHFSTMESARVDTMQNRLRLLKSTNEYKDMYLSIDGGGVIYDMKGMPLAFLTEKNGLGGYVVDMDFTKDSTITFVYVRGAFEVKLSGDIVWQAPQKNNVNTDPAGDIYHHQMTKLSNGHYMLLGMEFKMVKIIDKPDTSYFILSDNRSEMPGYKHGRFGTIVEYDKDGNVVWSWKDSEHLIGTDYDYFKSPVDTNLRTDPHNNSFYYDEANDVVYLSYRNLNRILKIDHKTGAILATYGENYKPHAKSQGYGWFCNPHGVRKSNSGELYYFNNNSCKNTDSLPTIVVLQEPAGGNEGLKKLWEYQCAVEGDYPHVFGAGGSMQELPDGSFYVCMGNEYSKMFIVDRDKKVKWSALPERYIPTEGRWVGNRQYRVNHIDRSQLEQLIWCAEKSLR